jgi:hypothetical protein
LRGVQIGQLLVEQGALSEAQVQHILAVQKMSHRPFGDLAERLYGINPKAIEDAWVEQYIRIAGVVDLEEQEVETESPAGLAVSSVAAASRRGPGFEHGHQRPEPGALGQLLSSQTR